MNLSLFTHWSTLGLMAALAALASLIAWQLDLSPERFDPAPDAGAGVADVMTILPDISRRPVQPQVTDVNFILLRPLFNPDRQPVRTTVVVAPEDTSVAHLSLVGVAIDGERKIALVSDTRARVELHLREGDRVGSWTVVNVSEDRTVLRDGTRTHELFRNFDR